MPKIAKAEGTEAIPLPLAAARARVRYARMLDYVLCGKVRGWQDAGRWWVDPDSLEAFAQANETNSRAAA